MSAIHENTETATDEEYGDYWLKLKRVVEDINMLMEGVLRCFTQIPHYVVM